jgi:hypothetical protein
LYMILCFLNAVIDIYCEPMPFMCGSKVQLFSFIIDQLVNNYLTSCMALYSILCEIFLTLQRIFLIRNISSLKHITVRIVGPVFYNNIVGLLPTLLVRLWLCTNRQCVFVSESELYRVESCS